ncbi:sigma-70 family RNA polymerase sigma factor [Streptomyces sp. NBC_00572]|uniref:sigma-70 family RNA polymerase sigma factor n=1 Tax=Streptomyces sp. NBC_00572 TaxID=2903664 RepID=UPI0022506C17|nr:sigma-70 family RNA polymerase sigma factor [Streptomyces sp. NBC_00572]MCX4984550.1 sigma-70 family RNA polymerase sigma factor [Streptomyces sp. NBC_00572]
MGSERYSLNRYARQTLIEEVRRVSAMQDHALRAKAAADLMTELQAAVIETSRMRKESIAWLRKNGHSMADVAKLMGVSRARVAQLKDAGPRPERAFLGTQHVQVAVPTRPGEREYVAVEDSSTGQKMLALAQSLQLEGELQYIPVSGEIDLNRDDLVVVCGPKSSAAAAAALSLDPRLSFETLPDGRWALVERESGKAYTSPSDDPQGAAPADVAYLGRLPRPDGQGTFILIAGVHAVGSLGVAHYLTANLASLYEEVGTSPFSMVVACDYAPEDKSVKASRAASGVLLHEAA